MYLYASQKLKSSHCDLDIVYATWFTHVLKHQGNLGQESWCMKQSMGTLLKLKRTEESKSLFCFGTEPEQTISIRG